jgi:hypothetical protein
VKDDDEAAMPQASGTVAEVVGEPSEANGITIAVGPPGSVTAVFGLEYPMRMVDRQMIALRERAIQIMEERRR